MSKEIETGGGKGKTANLLIQISGAEGEGDRIQLIENAGFEALDGLIRDVGKNELYRGLAMLRIRDGKLYRKGYKTFEQYCRTEHDMSPQYANKLIKAARILKEMEPIVSERGHPVPENEGQLRELARLGTTEERVEVFEKAIRLAEERNRRVTAALIAEVAKGHLPEKREVGHFKKRRIGESKTVSQKNQSRSHERDAKTLTRTGEIAKVLEEAEYGAMNADSLRPMVSLSDRDCIRVWSLVDLVCDDDPGPEDVVEAIKSVGIEEFDLRREVDISLRTLRTVAGSLHKLSIDHPPEDWTGRQLDLFGEVKEELEKIKVPDGWIDDDDEDNEDDEVFS